MLFTQAELDRAFAIDDPELHRLVYTGTTHPYYTFEPRVDNIDRWDEQSAFSERNYHWDAENEQYVYDDTERINFKICLGGNGSGKTIAAAHKTAEHVLTIPPPRPRCPFWIIGDTYDNTCDVCWNEKLSTIIPQSEILGVQWFKSNRNWPYAVFLRRPEKDRRHEVGWVLEFKSYEQGLKAMKAKSIGGYWFNEEVPYPIVAEVQARCRDYNSPGWADFTPVEVKSPEWPELYENTPAGWEFYHLNTECNTELADGWFEQFIATIPSDLQDTRRIGTFSTFSGQVFKEFRKSIHVVDPRDPETRRLLKLSSNEERGYIPHDWYRQRGADFGYNNPTCWLWSARDNDQRYYIYDEHYRAQWLHDQHAVEINKRHWDESNPYYGRTWSDHDSQEIAEYRKRGINCTIALKKPAAAITMLRSLMMVQRDNRPRLYIFNNCVNLIREIIGLRWPKGTVTRNPKDLPVDKDNHATDGLGYIVMSEARDRGASSVSAGHTAADSKRLGVHVSKWR